MLDVDTISQVKEKILDALHLNKPYSSRPSANQVSLGKWKTSPAKKFIGDPYPFSSPSKDEMNPINPLSSNYKYKFVNKPVADFTKQ